ncbi:MAG: hypothetical protein Sylvanvirus11_11 [Sylvanvirus sp.]|uniref:Uncharacterized protein n=1 Tax=Sylvanvirus sp. TaxID=2487774 RepID=A0A3G5AI63_9VIRU|nr:MAG: hypothetical protein Sylvanvirus11_11 [Sylvanvirus sp.]
MSINIKATPTFTNNNPTSSFTNTLSSSIQESSFCTSPIARSKSSEELQSVEKGLKDFENGQHKNLNNAIAVDFSCYCYSERGRSSKKERLQEKLVNRERKSQRQQG